LRLSRTSMRSEVSALEDSKRNLVHDTHTSMGRGYDDRKRILDCGIAIVALVLTSPLWLVAAVAISVDSPGRVFFVQQRVGKNGRRFRIFKFRSMRADAARYAPSPDSSQDPRLTRVGRVLRKCSLDELPQLLNVLR